MASRDTLIGEYLEHVDGAVLEDDAYRQAIAQMIRQRAGVYALYKGDKLYYVGLATNLMARVKHHLKDRHAGKWDRFSVYLAVRDAHIKPIESLLLRIAKPTGNHVKGRLQGARDLKTTLKREVKTRLNDKLAKRLGGQAMKQRRRLKTAEAKGTRVLAGLIDKRVLLKAEYKGQEYRATLRLDGRIFHAGALHDSPSSAAQAVVGRAANGWVFWKFKQARDWVPLSRLRR
jgi:hypothetical protein